MSPGLQLRSRYALTVTVLGIHICRMAMYRYSMPWLNPTPILIVHLPSLLQFRLCGRLLRVLLRACSGFAGELGIDIAFRKGGRGQAKMFKNYQDCGKARLTRESVVFEVCFRSVIV